MTKKTRNIIIGSTVGLIVIIIAYFLYKKYVKTSPLNQVLKEQNKEVVSSTFDWTKGNDDFPLKKFSYGDRVAQVQLMLNSLGSTLVVDKKFGDLTESELERHKQRSVVSEVYYNKLNLSQYQV